MALRSMGLPGLIFIPEISGVMGALDSDLV